MNLDRIVSTLPLLQLLYGIRFSALISKLHFTDEFLFPVWVIPELPLSNPFRFGILRHTRMNSHTQAHQRSRVRIGTEESI